MHSGIRRTVTSSITELVGLLESPPILARLDTHEKATLDSLTVIECNYPADTIIVEQGSRIRSVHLIRSGWCCVSRDLANGKRLIIDFPMKCDFIGLRTADGYSFNTIAALTPMSVFEIPLDALEKACEIAPHLGLIFIELLARQRAILIEHLTNVGCRNAFVKTAHFLLELADRVQTGSGTETNSFYCPITQYQLADALGLTPIHLNRTLRRLREEELVIFKSNRVEILDRERLIEVADYDSEFMEMSIFGKTSTLTL